jgi:predicted lipoprotein with Yx(FWY)xxD motif
MTATTGNTETTGITGTTGMTETTGVTETMKMTGTTGMTTTGSMEPATSLATTEHDLYGVYLVTDRGRAVYLFTADEGDTSACDETCAINWPPVAVESVDAMQTASEIDPSLLATIERTEGTVQLTYNGHPLYYFVRDAPMGEPQGHEIESYGGEWYLVTPAGEQVESE